MNPFFPIFSLLFLLPNITGDASCCRDLIPSTCKTISSENPGIKFSFCTTSLYPAPGSRCASLRGLGATTIRLTGYNLTDTRCHIKRLLNKPNKFNSFEKDCLRDCFDLYSDAIPSVKEAMKHFNNRKYREVNVKISGVMTFAVTCEDGFKERGLVSPLTKRNDHTFGLGAMTLSILNLIQQNGS